jgi:hypothetical protein
MTRFRTLLPALIVFAAGAVAGPAPAGDGEGGEGVLVELFTSQGCSSCPPADALLGALAAEPGIVPLALHVDYWDYLGWTDTFAQPAFTERQYGYRKSLGARMVFTPQAVVQGSADAVGSNAEHLGDLIAMTRERPQPASIELQAVAGGVACRIAPAGTPDVPGATIWVAVYDLLQEVDIDRGENGGHRLSYHNVVRTLTRHGAWSGAEAEEMTLPAPEAGQGMAIWLQDGSNGRVIAAAKFEP